MQKWRIVPCGSKRDRFLGFGVAGPCINMKRATGLVEGALGEAVGQIYVQRHFGKVAKERMVDLVKNLIQAYRVDIGALDWMSNETKQKAFLKLDKFYKSR